MVKGETPYLSVVVTARNDDHGGNLLGRMQAFVSGFISQANRHGLSSELIIVEWNPPDGRPSLMEALQWPSDAGACAVRLIEVPAELHRRYRHSEDLPLYQMIAKNVGIRRARGQFILATNIDILFSDELVEHLAQGKLERGRMYRIDRHDAMSGVPAGGGVEEQLAYCKSHLLRINAREGTFRVTRDGRRALETRDIAPPDSGVTFGAGWFTVEGVEGRRVYRAVDNHAEVFVGPPCEPPPPLIFDIQPAFGSGGRAFRLEAIVDGHVETGSIVVKGRTEVRVQLPPGCRSFRFHVVGGGYPSPHDPRIVNFCVFRCEWGKGRMSRLIEGRRAGVLTEVLTLLAKVRDVLGRMKTGAGNVQVPLPAGSIVRRLLGRRPEAGEVTAGSQNTPVFLHTNACGDFTLMAREHWFDLRAYPEFEIFSMNLDSVLCYAAHHGGAPQEILRDPLRIYHIEHATGSGWTPEGQAKLFARMEDRGIPWLAYRELVGWAEQMRRFGSTMIFNRDDWGLANEQLREVTLPAKVSTAI
jgi:hypothetical protein